MNFSKTASNFGCRDLLWEMGHKHYAEMQSLLQREGGGESICLGPALEMLQVIKSGWLKKSITPLDLPQLP